MGPKALRVIAAFHPGTGVYLADQGAYPIKIEPITPDDARRVFTQPPMTGGHGVLYSLKNVCLLEFRRLELQRDETTQKLSPAEALGLA